MKERKELLDLSMGIVVFGSLWGAAEATLGGILHLVDFPYTGAIMANIGFVLMATAVALYRRPNIVLGIGLVASSFKFLDILLLSLSPLARRVVNPAVAIILEALAFQVVVSILWKPYLKSRLAQAGAGVLGIYLAYIGISLSFFYILRRGPKDVMTPLGLITFALQDGAIAASLALFAVPLGRRLGELLRVIKERIAPTNSRFFYRGALVTVALCWLAAALSLIL